MGRAIIVATASLPAPEMKRLTTKSVKPRTVDFGNSSTNLAIWSWPPHAK